MDSGDGVSHAVSACCAEVLVAARMTKEYHSGHGPRSCCQMVAAPTQRTHALHPPCTCCLVHSHDPRTCCLSRAPSHTPSRHTHALPPHMHVACPTLPLVPYPSTCTWRAPLCPWCPTPPHARGMPHFAPGALPPSTHMACPTLHLVPYPHTHTWRAPLCTWCPTPPHTHGVPHFAPGACRWPWCRAMPFLISPSAST